MLGGIYLPVNIGDQILIGDNKVESRFFLVDVYDIIARLVPLADDQFLHHVAFTHASLAGKYNQNAFSKQDIQLRGVVGSINQVHSFYSLWSQR